MELTKKGENVKVLKFTSTLHKEELEKSINRSRSKVIRKISDKPESTCNGLQTKKRKVTKNYVSSSSYITQSEPVVDDSSDGDLPRSCYTKKPNNEDVQCIFRP